MIEREPRVAVHYNFATRNLSVREICPGGSLGRLLSTVDTITLQDCQFTANRQRWRKWRSGEAPKVRQFDPRIGPDFLLRTTAQPRVGAALVRISGRKILAARPQMAG